MSYKILQYGRNDEILVKSFSKLLIKFLVDEIVR